MQRQSIMKFTKQFLNNIITIFVIVSVITSTLLLDYKQLPKNIQLLVFGVLIINTIILIYQFKSYVRKNN